MSVMPALTQTEDGGYSELETGGDQAGEGGGAQTVQGSGEAKSDKSEADGTRGVRGGGRGRVRHRS